MRRFSLSLLALLLLLLLLASPTFAAVKRWVGGAGPVRQVTTIAVTGVWGTNDTATLTIAGNDLTLTLGTDVATTDVAAEVAAMVDASNATDNLVGATSDETRNFGGEELGVFVDLDSTASGSTITLTSATAGVPFTVTASESTASTGALGTPTTTTAASGPNHFDEADNWEGGVAPATTDVLVFDSGNIDVLYGLDNAILDIFLTRYNGYTGDIGLPPVNAARGYPEYRQRYLQLPITAVSGTSTHTIGGGSGTAAGRTYLDFGGNNGAGITLTVRDAAKADSYGSKVKIVGGVEVSALVYGGSVSFGEDRGQTTCNLETLETGYTGTTSTAADVLVGAKTTFNTAGETLIVKSGTLTLDADISGSSNELKLYAGTLTIYDSANVNYLYVYGGTVDYRANSCDKLVIYGGEVDARKCDATTFSDNIELFKGGIFRDTANVFGSSAIDLNGCEITDVTLELKPNLSLTPSLAGSPPLE